MNQPRKRRLHKQTGYMLLSLVLALALGISYYMIHQQDKQEEAKRQQIFVQYEKTLREKQRHVTECYQSVLSTVQRELPGIVCWGDSLTAGTGGDDVSYPLVLDQLIQTDICQRFQADEIEDVLLVDNYDLSIPVQNMGVEGESTHTILGRAGAVPYVISEAVALPENKTPVPIQIRSQNGSAVSPLRQGEPQLEITLQEVEGILTLDKSSNQYYFTRSSFGEPVAVEAGTAIVPKASLPYAGYLPILWMGQNGGWDTTEDLILQQRSLLYTHTQNPDRYLILGLTTGTAENRASLEAAMTEAFGERFLNLREYLSTQGIADAGLTPTPEDAAAMSQGAVPKSLLSDDIHLNAKGYELVGQKVYERLVELGDFTEILNTIDQCMSTANRE